MYIIQTVGEKMDISMQIIANWAIATTNDGLVGESWICVVNHFSNYPEPTALTLWVFVQIVKLQEQNVQELYFLPNLQFSRSEQVRDDSVYWCAILEKRPSVVFDTNPDTQLTYESLGV